MEPSYSNGVMVHPIGDGTDVVGFYIENGNDETLPAYIDENHRQELAGTYTVKEARERLLTVKNAVEEKGYTAGPIEVKTHKDWCVEVFGISPEQYDRNRQEEDQVQDALDKEYDDFEE